MALNTFGALEQTRLAGGEDDRCQSCPDERYAGVQELDLGPSRAVFVWRLYGTDDTGDGLFELRVAPLDGRRSRMLTSARSGEADTGRLYSPNAGAAKVTWLSFATGGGIPATSVVAYDPRGGTARTTPHARASAG